MAGSVMASPASVLARAALSAVTGTGRSVGGSAARAAILSWPCGIRHRVNAVRSLPDLQGMSRSIASASDAPTPAAVPFAADFDAWRGGAHHPDLGVERARSFVLATLDSLVAHVAVLDEHGTILVTNASWDRFAAENGGGPTAGGDYLGACDAAADEPTARAAAQGIRAILSGSSEQFELEYPCHAPDQERWFLLRAVRHRSPGPARVVVQHDDITARRKAEDAARVRARLLDEVDAAVIAADLSGCVTHWSGGAERLYGWTAAETLGRPVTDLALGEAAVEEIGKILAGIAETGRRESRFDVLHKDGSSFPVLIRDVAIYGVDGALTGVVGVSVDLSASVEAERQLRAARNFSRAVTDSMGEGLCALDVDGLLVYMNPAAEAMLGWTLKETVGQPMHELIHSHRPDGTTLAAADCPILRTRLTGEVVRVEEDSFCRRDGTRLAVSYTAAPFETAEGFRGSAYVFTDITERKADRERLESELDSLSWIPKIRDALDEERFILHAQPIVDLATGETVQHELLIRMNDRDGRLVPPGLFLPAAEEHGLIADIDRWVIRQAAELAGRGHAVELNISAESLAQPGLLEVVQRELRRTAADPGLLVFELTETALLRSERTAKAFIDGIAALGCDLALDDFGTGYGGFTYLKRFPVNYLKIDIEFVRELPRDEASQHVVHAVVSLAKGFGQKTVAEGVEDAETLALLREFGVDYAQGYFLGRPAPLAETVEALGR
jgi:PAS domain S-box-containing protein